MTTNTSYSKQAERKQHFKSGIDFQGARKRREEANITLRKANRSRLLKRRREAPVGEIGENVSQETLSTIPLLATALGNDDAESQLEAVQQFRKLLHFATNGIIDAVISGGVVPRFAQLLGVPDYPIQFETAWALTNITSGTSAHCEVVKSAGAVPKLVELIACEKVDVAEQAIWCLANIAADSVESRDFIWEHGVLTPLLRVVQKCNRPTVKRNAVWALLNLVSNKPTVQPYQKVAPIIPVLSNLLHSQDEIVLLDTCTILATLSSGGSTQPERIDSVLQANLLPRLVELLATTCSQAVQPAVLTVIGNLVSGNDRQTQQCINSGGLLAVMHSLLASPRKIIRKQTCWTISQICAGTQDQLEAIINAGLIVPLIHCLSAEFAVQKEALWALKNAFVTANPKQKRTIIERGTVIPFCEVLHLNDTKTITLALSGLQYMLEVGEEEQHNTGGINIVGKIIQDCGGLDRLEALQEHESNEVYQHVVQVLEQFFEVEDVVDLSVQPAPTADGSAFQFGQASDVPLTPISV